MANKSKTIWKLDDGELNEDSSIPFSGKDGKAYKFPFFDNRKGLTTKNKGVVPRPTQAPAKVYITGDMSAIGHDASVPVKIEYVDEYGTHFIKKAEMELQGDSSLNRPKKNYNIDLINWDDSSFDIKFGDWAEFDTFTLKADWTDVTHSRNICVSRLVYECMCTRPLSSRWPWSKPFSTADKTVNSNRNTGARCVIDGFPMELHINGVHQGLYSWNLNKKKDNFNIEKNEPLQIVMLADVWQAWDYTAPYYHPDRWDMKYPKTPTQATTDACTRFMTWISTVSSANFATTYQDYVNLDYCIDYYLFCLVFALWDQERTNCLMHTRDGLIWWPIIYDSDFSFGCEYFVSTYADPSYQSAYNDVKWTSNHLWGYAVANFLPKIKQRYAELRSNILSPEHVAKVFEDYTNGIPIDLYAKDAELWPQNDITRINNESVVRITDWYRARIALIDPQFNYNPNPTALII